MTPTGECKNFKTIFPHAKHIPVEGSAVPIAHCSCIPCATPAQDRGSLGNAKQVHRMI